MRKGLILLWMLLCSVAPAQAQISIGIGLPNVSIGINLPMYPELVPVPGYPVYYAPRLNSNYFFYDGMYWVYQGDNWYASSWYNGPWGMVNPEVVPLYVLRIPVRYYRQAPEYFRGWQPDAPPRWGEHWGNDWVRRRSGWDRWNRNAVPARPPLPVYQKKYSGDRYPRVEQQQELHSQNYRYQPRDPAVRQQYQTQRSQTAPVPDERGAQGKPHDRNPGPQGNQRPSTPRSPQQGEPNAPHAQQQGGPSAKQQGQPPRQGGSQRPQPAATPHRPETESQGKGAPQEQKQRQGQGKGQRPGQENDREKGDKRDQDHGK